MECRVKPNQFIVLAIIVALVASFSMYQETTEAGIISVPEFSADSSVTHLNTFRTTVVDVVNGQIQGSATTGSTTNILADSIGELDMGDEVNPRVRDAELLGIGTDSTSAQESYVFTGLTPADDSDLSSDISAGTAYINGYRVVKTATAKTYTASMDTYVDLSQTGVYTFSEVSVGSAAPAVASNSARLAKVTTDGTEITAVTDLANRILPGVIIPVNYRSGMFVSRDSTTTVTVEPGVVEINDSTITKSTTTTLTISTAGDWAGGTSLRATSTMGFVGISDAGSIKLHTTAPTNQNYDLTVTAGKKRYATWSATVYRVIGWFYMNATGSGELDTYGVGNIKEGDIANTITRSNPAANNAVNDTAYGSDITNTDMTFYSSGGRIRADYNSYMTLNGSAQASWFIIDIDGVDKLNSERRDHSSDNGQSISTFLEETFSQGTHTFAVQASVDAGTTNFRANTVSVEEL